MNTEEPEEEKKAVGQDFTKMSLISTHICKTSDVGFHGNLFGGQLLCWIDEAGAALSAEFAETGKVVTKHISEVNFQSPVRPGQIIRIYGAIKKVGNTSLSVEVEARRHSIYNGTQKTVCKCENKNTVFNFLIIFISYTLRLIIF